MDEKINLQFSLEEDNFKLIENDGYCSIAEIDFLHLGTNRNKCNISQECVEKSLQTFYNKPLLCILNNSEPSLAMDFKEHARSLGEKNKFIALGTIPESSQFRYVERDNGKTYLNAKVVIWKNYFPVIMNILKNRKGNVKVSIELAVIDGKQDDVTGILDIKEFRLLSCVLLGENVLEGIEGSHLEILRFSYDNDEIKKANEYYLNFSYKNSVYEIPNEIKSIVEDELNSYKKIGKGCTNQELAFANTIINDKYINRTQLDKITKIFSTIKNSKKNKKLTYNILGGENMLNWITDIENGKVGGILMNSLSNNELQDQIWKCLDKYKYHDGEWEGRKYYVEEIYSDEKIAIIRDNETAKYYKIKYTIEDNIVHLNMDDKKEVHRSYEEINRNEKEFKAIVFSKSEYGIGESIKVEKSKESISDKPWGEVNKSELRKAVLSAKNYKELVKDVYMLVEEGWEDAPSTKLKYPVMEIVDGKAVYNRNALSSALGYAEKEDETSVISKVKSLYKKLDIDNNDKGGEKEMAKIDEENKIENKLDKDNKDIEKIKDDAEAQEDDVKEEEKKNAKECENSVCKNSDEEEAEDKEEAEEKEEEKKEEIDNKMDEGNEGLEDDVDADKDYWKKKANALEEKCSAMEKELCSFRRAEEERKMSEEIDKFAHCMSDEEVSELRNSIKEMSLDTMKEKINSKLADFALKMKAKEEEEKKEEKEVKYSINPFIGFADKIDFSAAKEAKSLIDIIENSNVKIAYKK